VSEARSIMALRIERMQIILQVPDKDELSTITDTLYVSGKISSTPPSQFPSEDNKSGAPSKAVSKPNASVGDVKDKMINQNVQQNELRNRELPPLSRKTKTTTKKGINSAATTSEKGNHQSVPFFLSTTESFCGFSHISCGKP
jgi:hypothetical protein